MNGQLRMTCAIACHEHQNEGNKMKQVFRLTYGGFASTVILLFGFHNLSIAQANFWQATKGPLAGNVYSSIEHPSGYIFAGSDNDIYRSTDGGGSWTGVCATDAYVSSLALGPSSSIFAATNGGSVYTSNDTGSTWTKLNTDFFNNIRIYSIVVNPGGTIFIATGGGVYASSDDGNTWNGTQMSGITQSLIIGPNGTMWSGLYNGQLWNSTDGGNNWSLVWYNFPNYARALAFDSKGDMFVGTSGGVYRSTDNENTFTNVALTDTPITSIAIDSAGQVFAGTAAGVYVSSNDGGSWTDAGLPTMVQTLLTDSKGNLYAGTPGGLYLSADNARNWSEIGLWYALTLKLAVFQSGKIIAATGEGVYSSSDNGNLWINDGLTGYCTSIVVSPSNEAFAGMLLGGINASTDEGNDWFGNGLGNTGISSLEVTPNGYLFAAGYQGSGIFLSADSALSWNQVYAGSLTPISWAASSNGYVYAGVNSYSGTNLGILRTTDNGNTWMQLNNGLANNLVLSLLVNPNGDVYAGTAGGGIYLSSDNGNSWSYLGLMDRHVWSLNLISSNEILAGTDSGVYSSPDGGVTWVPNNGGLADLYINSITLSPNGYVFAATGSGVFRSSQPLTDVKAKSHGVPEQFALFQNYPNPFNPTTIISYQLHTNALVVLRVFDVLGREVETLVNERQNAGAHTVTFNGTNLPSGVYFYSLEAGTYHDTMKMLLLK